MASLEFSREEVENLAQKLHSVQDQLSESERALLLAVFAAAGDHVDVVVRTGDAEPTTADLRSQIVKAFVPGDDHIYVIPYRIGYDPTPNPHPNPNPNPNPDPTPSPKPAVERPAGSPSSDKPPA
jgi:Asp-tRNA(Asn)/Glu-tRNA(Gln) amidotransferase C subunit